MSEFKKVEAESELYLYDGDEVLGPGKATQRAKSEFADEHDVEYKDVIGTKLGDGKIVEQDGEWVSDPGPVIAVFHRPIEEAEDL